MTTTGWLPAPAEDLFGPDATAEESYDVLTVDVPPPAWTAALRVARDRLSCTYFDWLSAVDEPGTGFRVSAHVVALSPVRRLLVRTTIPHDAPTLASAVDVYAGAAWHERETHEMFGVAFEGHPALDHLLLPETFEGHPLRKDFVLAARVAKAWPGAKEPGESEHGGPKRRQMLPPGVPDPNEWGPLKGQLPPAPARPARTPAARATGDRPVRRARTASQGSSSQTAPTATPPPATASDSTGGPGTAPTPPATAPPTADPTPATPGTPAGPRRARSASLGSASQRPQSPAAPSDPPARPSTAPRSSDAPWHHARPAFDAPQPDDEAPAARKSQADDEAPAAPKPQADDEATATPTPQAADEPSAAPKPQADEEPAADPSPERPSRERPRPGRPTSEPPSSERPAPDDDPAGGPQ
ncbi:NADH:ubiquinone oxidoreductase subunit C [Streptomyces achromogenes]|uniref:NADH:ubiquinone oxidoreductase subunit C n=1 Tax=Streptomyces achromogenes TaxID=67255 RepID=A0ABU0Q4M5_STRAH|nr:NADH-quinone oxidoreductase subunit C [Streptomyces achromogenes]MDQ0685614.1 NADH:ubiquinone oxidoreductase subunit C [Streptomyces achromogenes]